MKGQDTCESCGRTIEGPARRHGSASYCASCVGLFTKEDWDELGAEDDDDAE